MVVYVYMGTSFCCTFEVNVSSISFKFSVVNVYSCFSMTEEVKYCRPLAISFKLSPK